MGLFKKVEETKSGLKVLAFGSTGTGKTTFALSFPEVVAIDSEAGMAFYKKNPNLKHILETTSCTDVEEALEEIEDELMDEIGTFVIDSETKIYENMQIGGLSVAEKRARVKGQSVDDANLSQREWGKIKMINKKLQASKIMLGSRGVNVISIAQEKELKEKKGDNWVVVGHAPDTAKAFEYDYDISLRLFTETDSSGEEIYKAEVRKDRTQVFKKNQIIENPSFDMWKDVYDHFSNLKEDVVNYKEDAKKDETKMESELEHMDKLIASFKTTMKSMTKGNQTKVQEKLKELKIENPLRTHDYEGMKKLMEFVETL